MLRQIGGVMCGNPVAGSMPCPSAGFARTQCSAPHNMPLHCICYGQPCVALNSRLTFMAMHSAKYCVPYFSAPATEPTRAHHSH